MLDPATAAAAGAKPSSAPSLARAAAGKEGYCQLLSFLSMGRLPLAFSEVSTDA